jgi:hypothetical protein
MSDPKSFLREWGFDLDTFETRAKTSIDAARGDLSEVSGALRQALGEAKQVIVGLQRNGAPVASELKSGFEQAWQAIESAFGRAKERMREEKPADPAPPDEAPPTA